MKILICILIILILLTAVLNLVLSIRYRHVNRGLRFPGWLISVFTRYDSVKGLKRFSGMANRFMPLLFRERDRKLSMERISVPGQDGNQIPLLICRRKAYSSKDAVGLLWIHGGGYAIGTPGAEKSFLKPLILETNTVAVVPDYRRSDAAPYPAAFQDCCSALLWMKEHAAELGINESQLFVGGASAGGGLAAAVALYARDTGKISIAFQMPVYPMLNDRMDTASMIGNTGMLWDEKRNRAAWQLYLGDLYSTEQVPPYAAPARETDFSGLPPAYTFVGTLDPFLDETLAYAEALRACGIEAKCDIYEQAFHGFDVIPSKISTRARAKLLSEYQHAAAHCFAPQNSMRA